MDLHELTARLHAIRDRNDWRQFHSPKNLAMAASVEMAELVEIFQWLTEDQSRTLLAEVLNPVACKVGPEIGRDQLLALCERLDPRREPGRLTLIARMGAQKVGERLPPLVEAVRAAGHPVIWLSDPMHGNTIVAPCGNKTRLVRSIAEEVAAFRLAVSGSGGVAAGLHLETTPDDVTECVADSSGLHQVGRHYTSLCDPRLNPWQALSAVMAWAGAEAIPSATFPLETVA